jgi:hypothetical protein
MGNIDLHILITAKVSTVPRKVLRPASAFVCFSLLVIAYVFQQSALADNTSKPSTLTQAASSQGSVSAKQARASSSIRHADFKHEDVSQDARDTANWIVDSGDNLGMPFIIIDKKQARVLVFAANGQLGGTASVLLGLAIGDDSVPGIGQRKLSSIQPHERTTPAGRFIASLAHNLKGEEILWIDYKNAIALHPVVTSNTKEHRTERLASSNLQDKRISYGCINVPANFYRRYISPAFSGTNGVVYVLPETRPKQNVFISYYGVE